MYSCVCSQNQSLNTNFGWLTVCRSKSTHRPYEHPCFANHATIHRLVEKERGTVRCHSKRNMVLECLWQDRSRTILLSPPLRSSFSSLVSPLCFLLFLFHYLCWKVWRSSYADLSMENMKAWTTVWLHTVMSPENTSAIPISNPTEASRKSSGCSHRKQHGSDKQGE